MGFPWELWGRRGEQAQDAIFRPARTLEVAEISRGGAVLCLIREGSKYWQTLVWVAWESGGDQERKSTNSPHRKSSSLLNIIRGCKGPETVPYIQANNQPTHITAAGKSHGC